MVTEEHTRILSTIFSELELYYLSCPSFKTAFKEGSSSLEIFSIGGF